jgi:hypothetical protein
MLMDPNTFVTQVAFAGWIANKSPTARTEPAMIALIMRTPCKD